MALLVKHSNLELDELEFDPISDLCDPAVLPVLPVRRTHRPAASAATMPSSGATIRKSLDDQVMFLSQMIQMTQGCPQVFAMHSMPVR